MAKRVRRRVSTGIRGATIKDVAARIGLAHSTVSRALNNHPAIGDKTKARVRRAAAELNYVANSSARLMRSGKSRIVGLIVPDIENDFYSSATRGMPSYCSSENYQLLLAVSEDDPEKERNQVLAFREARVEGIVIAATKKPARDTIQMLRDLPAVQFLRRHRSIGSHSVSADDALGIALATDHLVRLGHSRIGLVGVTPALSTGQGRLEGYRRSLLSAGIGVDPALIQTGDPQPEFARAAVKQLLNLSQPPSAIVVASPRLMFGVLEVVAEERIDVPGRLSLISYGDVEWFHSCRPGISAVALPTAAMAEAAASLLFQRIATSVGRRVLKSGTIRTRTHCTRKYGIRARGWHGWSVRTGHEDCTHY